MRATLVVSDQVVILDGKVVLGLGPLAFFLALPIFEQATPGGVWHHVRTEPETPVIGPDGQQLRLDIGPLKFDMSSLAAKGITAVQWYGTFGEVEYETVWLPEEKRWDRKPNEYITDFSPYQAIIAAGIDAERARADAAETERQRLESVRISKAISAQLTVPALAAD